MSARVLIVDSVADRRAVVADALLAARYEVAECGDAEQAGAALGQGDADLVLLDLGDAEGAEGAARAAVAVRRLRDLPAGRAGGPAPILALARPERIDLRLAAIREGAEAAIERCVAPRLLQARIRALIRARDADRELRFHDEAEGLGLAAPGLSEGPAAFLGAAEALPLHVVLIDAHGDQGRDGEPAGDPGDGGPAAGAAAGGDVRAPPGSPAAAALGRVCTLLGRPLSLREPAGAEAVPLPCEGTPCLDLVLLDARGLRGDPGAASEALTRLVDLRSHPSTRGAAVVLLLPPGAIETAALALDLGAGEVIAGPPDDEEAVARIVALLRRRAEADRLRDRIRSHLRAAVRDPLTGLHNRRYAEPALLRMTERARRAGRPLAVLLLDIDHFKAVNDRFGHAAGDRVLAEVARRLAGWLRDDDLVARFGGEEFLVVLPDTGPAEARAVADALRHRIGSRPIRLGGPQDAGSPSPRAEVRVTVSVGVAALQGRPQLAAISTGELLDRADSALYAAKGAGRNMVSLALGVA